MSWRTHFSLHVLDGSSFPLVTRYFWAAALSFRLPWWVYAQFFRPSIFSGVHKRLPDGFAFVHLEVVVAVKALGPKLANCLLRGTLVVAQQAFLVEHANHVPARLLVHHNMIAALVLFKQDFMRPPVGFSNVLHVVHSSAA